MSIFDEDWLKKLLSGKLASDDEVGQPTGNIPIPTQRPIEAVALGPNVDPTQVAATTQEQQPEPYKPTGLLGMPFIPKAWRPESKEQQLAVAQALIMGGANGLANPGMNGWATIGNIAGAAVPAYNESLASQLKTQTDKRKLELDQQTQSRRDLLATLAQQQGGDIKMRRQRKAQMAALAYQNGDDETYRKLMGELNELDNFAHSKGLEWDEASQSYKPGAGIQESTDSMAESEAAAKERGKNSEAISPDQLKYNEYVKWMKENGKQAEILGPDDYRLKIKKDEEGVKVYESDRDYQQYMADETAAGRKPLSKTEWKKSFNPKFRATIDKDGKTTIEQGTGGSDGDVKFTESQSKDVGFYSRGRGALDILNPNEKELSNFWEDKAGYVPFFGNYLKSDERQSAEQAGKEFLMAILRKDTGAAITPAEEEYYGQIYLPQPGDGDKQIAQKRLARERALEALKAGMNIDQIERTSLAADAEEKVKKEQNIGTPKVTDADIENRKKYPNAIPIGTVKNGHTYIGGPMNNRKSWK